MKFYNQGVNSAHAWWDNYNRNVALNSIPHIAKTGANTVFLLFCYNFLLKFLHLFLFINFLFCF
jgi:hypothetical protein